MLIEKLKKNFKVLIFPEADEKWLDYVSSNRNGIYSGEKYDIIYEPVANDVIYRTFIAYEEGILTKKETIARLKASRLYDQMVFASEPALSQFNCYGVIDYIRDYYGSLHTTGRQYIVDDISMYIEKKQSFPV